MLGALLITLAVLGVVVAHLSATASPDTRYLVASSELASGTLLADTAAVQRSFRSVAIDLPDDVAAGAVTSDQAAQLVGRRVTAALVPGDLVRVSALAEVGADAGTTAFSFAVPPESAVGGSLVAGDRIDVVATVGTGESATTAYVVRAATLLEVAGTDTGLGGASVRLTVELDDTTRVQALAHALATATVVVVRSPGDDPDLPAPYRFAPDAPATGPGATDPDAGPGAADPDAGPGAPGPDTDPGLPAPASPGATRPRTPPRARPRPRTSLRPPTPPPTHPPRTRREPPAQRPRRRRGTGGVVRRGRTLGRGRGAPGRDRPVRLDR